MPSIPREATDALPLLTGRLGSSARAIYLHGSAVAGGLRKRSDVDLLVIVEESLSATTRARLPADLMAISGLYPFDPAGRRPLEVIIFRSIDLQPMPYPMRAEFVYGEWLRGALEEGLVPQAEANPEYTLLLAQARREAVPLMGPDIIRLVPEIPANMIPRAIHDLLPSLLETVDGDARNVLLTLARMWGTLVTGEFVAKDAAADWAGPQLSDRGAATLSRARDAYLGQEEDGPQFRRADIAQAVEEMRAQILSVPASPPLS